MLNEQPSQFFQKTIVSGLPQESFDYSILRQIECQYCKKREMKGKVESSLLEKKIARLNHEIAELKYECELFKWQTIRMFQQFNRQCVHNIIQIQEKSFKQSLKVQQQKDQYICLLENKNQKLLKQLDCLSKKIDKNENLTQIQKSKGKISNRGKSEKLFSENKDWFQSTVGGSFIEFGLEKSCLAKRNDVSFEKRQTKKHSFFSEEGGLSKILIKETIETPSQKENKVFSPVLRISQSRKKN